MSFGGGNYLYQSGGVMVDNSNDFSRLAQSLGQNVTKIQHNSDRIKAMSARMAKEENDGKLGEEQLQLIHYTKQLVQETSVKVRELNQLATATGSDSERKQRRMQKDRLIEKFTATVNEFKDVQLRATETQKECVQRARLRSMRRADAASAVAGSGSDSNLIDIRSSPSNDSFDPLDGRTSQQRQQAQQQIALEEEENLAGIRQREQDIMQLESDIVDLNQIFKDLGMMVHEQGEVIDSIEANVESAAVHVEEGNLHLGQAENYQKKARKKMCVLVVVAIVILAVVILVLYLSLRS